MLSQEMSLDLLGGLESFVTDNTLVGDLLDLRGASGEGSLQDVHAGGAEPHPLDHHHVGATRLLLRLRLSHDVRAGVGHGLVVELGPVKETEECPGGVLDLVEVHQVSDQLLPTVTTVQLDGLTEAALNLLTGRVQLDQGLVHQPEIST